MVVANGPSTTGLYYNLGTWIMFISSGSKSQIWCNCSVCGGLSVLKEEFSLMFHVLLSLMSCCAVINIFGNFGGIVAFSHRVTWLPILFKAVKIVLGFL